jgi:O-antigen/teichoic acid export membrane protein
MVYGGAWVLRSTVGFFLLPILTRVVAREEYAALDLVVAASALVALLANFQLRSSAVRYYHQQRAAGRGLEFLGGMLGLRVVSALALVVPLLLLAQAGIGYMPPVAHAHLLWTAALVLVPLSLGSELLFQYMRLLEWKWRHSLLSIVEAATGGALAISLVIWSPYGVAGYLIGQAGGVGLVLAVSVWLLRPHLRLRLAPPGLRQVLAFSLPLVPAALLGWAWHYAARFVMAAHLPLADIAVYALAMKVLLFMNVVSVAFRASWEPLAMKVLHERGEQSAHWYAASFGLYAGALLLLSAALAAFAKPLVAILGPSEYSPAAALVPFLAVAAALRFAAIALNIGNEVAARTAAWSWAALASIIIMLAVLLGLMGRFGILAAGIGAVAGAALMVAIVFFTAQRRFPVPYPRSGLLAAILGAAGILAIHSLSLAAGLPSPWPELAMLAVGALSAWNTLLFDDRRRLLKRPLAPAGGSFGSH